MDEAAVRKPPGAREGGRHAPAPSRSSMRGSTRQQERRLAELARDAGFAQVSASHEVSPLLGLIPRARPRWSTPISRPILNRYVDQVAAELGGTRLYFMQSHGGLAEAAAFQRQGRHRPGRQAASSALRAPRRWRHRPFVGFDMGGTSTDVALYAGAFERSFETEVAGVRMRAPMMAINTVAAGGGSILHFDGARFPSARTAPARFPGPPAIAAAAR